MDFGFDEWQKKHKNLDLDGWIIRNNVKGWDKMFQNLRYRCQAPGCGYPLRQEDCYHIVNFGNVCNLCHYLYNLVSARAFFIAAHQQDEELGKKNRKGDR